MITQNLLCLSQIMEYDNNSNYSGNVHIYEWNDTTILWVKCGGDIEGELAYNSSGNSVINQHINNIRLKKKKDHFEVEKYLM